MKKPRRIRPKLGVQPYYFLLALAEIIIAAGLALLLNWLLEDVLEFRLAPWLWVVVFSVILSAVLGWLLSVLFFDPIARLSRAMRQVGAGDFSIQLETSSRIREVRDTYDNFNLMTQELGATEIIQTDFVSNVSHEFKTPINAIAGYATLLQSGPQTPEQAMYVEKILLNTQRLNELVSNILLLSRVDHQAISTQSTRYRLDEQIRQAVVLLEPKWAEKDLDLDVDLDTVEYTGSESMMLHVWVNLMDNAIKFDPFGGLLRLRLHREGDRAVFTVEDSGPGIPADAQKHIFDKFYQADSSRMAEGNGLGLALVKRVLDICGGTVAVENLPEAGCRFTITLPLGQS
ncbi:MAG: HAMP domain-containing histidine kinase [Ruminococcaceae bacterium]|nr:HAMP domain-containing histidine kinase [Oscillospiraceae bacterium]